MAIGDPISISTGGGVASAVSIPVPATVQNRGLIVQLGRLTGLNLNGLGNTTIFTTPAAGFTRCVIAYVVLTNYSTAATTASVAFGSSSTPTNWKATATNASAAANTLTLYVAPAGAATYGTSTLFVADVTIVQGSAATCDVDVFGYYV